MKNKKLQKGYSKADYHIHSSIGDAIATPEEIVDYCEKFTDLSIIAITDHDQIKGGISAREYAKKKKYNLEVIAGEEVSTSRGHLVGLFMKTRIKRYTNLVDTIKSIHGQGGICIVPHPLSWLTTSIGERAFRKIIEHRDDDVYFDAVEMINPAIAGKVTAVKAKKMNQFYWKLPVVGGSDAHSLDGIGIAYTIFKGKTAEDFKNSIKNGTTSFDGRYMDFNEHWILFIEKLKRFKVF
ncbi:MAG: PHP domain-containing protein [Candidatus Goldbacteria bacterium]|nr:PHP domain-containing protein [Candidatus Goldiibacteriota bacterium]